jgi:hypothetical protein
MIMHRAMNCALFVFAALWAHTQSASAQPDACAKGYVWREAFEGDHICVTPDTRERAKLDNANSAEFREKDSDTCIEGFVWRLANLNDHVCVPQTTREETAQDNQLAFSRLASGAPEPPPPNKAPSLPMPPARVGCHVFSEGAWRKIPCASPEETRKLRRPIALSIKDGQRWVKLGRDRFYPFTLPLRLGAINIELLSDPTLGTVTDVPLTPVGLCPNVTTTTNIANSFSIQLNTNTFTTSYSGTGWVQFVYQTTPGIGDFLCVWKIDLGVANATGNANGYEPICVNPQSSRTLFGQSAAGSRGEYAEVEGWVHTEGGATLITTWAQLPWAFPYAYAVTTTDTITGSFRGLSNDTTQYSFGLNGRWTQVTGDIYGTGCGSRAVFTGTQIFERLIAATCTMYPYCSSLTPTTQFSLSNYATPVPDPNVTAEGNNLLPTISLLNIPHLPNTTFSCIYPDVCERWGTFHSPN